MPDDLPSQLTRSISTALPPVLPQQTEIQPSAIASFLRSDQCRRQLRFNLADRDTQRRIAHLADVELEPLPPTLTRSGRLWEEAIEDQLLNGEAVLVPNAAINAEQWQRRIAALPPGTALITTQSTLTGRIGDWPVDEARPDLIRFARSTTGDLSILVADLKASHAVELEHRVQVAMYAELLQPLFPEAEISQAVLYRQPLEPEAIWTPTIRADHQAAADVLGLGNDACLSITPNPAQYSVLLGQLIAAPTSVTASTASTPFEEIPFHIAAKCDTCRFNRICLATANADHDLSLIPNLSEQSKVRLQQHDFHTVDDLAALDDKGISTRASLLLVPGLGPQIGSLINRAIQLQRKQRGEPVQTWNRHPHPSTLPRVDREFNPDLIQILIDLQTDSGTGRVALASASVTVHRDGVPGRTSRTSHVHFPANAVQSEEDEANLIEALIRDLIVALADAGRNRADGQPIHLYFWDATQVRTLTALANRQGNAIFGLDAVVALLSQHAGFEDTNHAVLADEVHNQRTLPILCQSLQTIAPWFGHRWSPDLRKKFRYRMFDESLREIVHPDDEPQFVPARSRFMSSIPSEYMQRAWNQLVRDDSAGNEPKAAQTWSLYGQPSSADIVRLQEERLVAMEAIRDGLNTNPAIRKSGFDLRSLNRIGLRESTPVEALHQFVLIERHIEVAEWRALRSASPDVRFLRGDSIPVRFHDADQPAETLALIEAARTRQNTIATSPIPFREMDKETQKQLRWSLDGARIVLRLADDALPVSAAAFRRISNYNPGDRVVYGPLWVDEHATEPRLSSASRLLRGNGANLDAFADSGRIEITHQNRAFRSQPGFGFTAIPWIPADGELLVIDDRPDAESGSRQIDVIQAIQSGANHASYRWIASPSVPKQPEDPRSMAAQQRFMDGLDRFGELLPDAPRWEAEKQRYIGTGSHAPVTVVQGPPGTGKSTTSGMAAWARMQAAMATGQPCRVALGCKTHAATDVLLRAIDNARERLREFERHDATEFARYFDARIFDVPLYRFAARSQSRYPEPPGSTAEARINALLDREYAIVAATTNGLGRFVATQWQNGLTIWDIVLLDEASQMSVPEFLVATTGLQPDGRMIVVGDHRQMPPIVHSIDEDDHQTTIDPFPAWRSIFDFVRNEHNRDVVDIRFSQSFRIHRDVAEFLRRAVYQADGINLHSARTSVHQSGSSRSELAQAILGAANPLVLVLHDEQASQQQNDLEATIAADLVDAMRVLEEPPSLGVVVPHRAQRAAIDLLVANGDPLGSKVQVDTVERFQGDERDVIIYSATESDPVYLRATGDFLFDPRRLNVAISRARQKLIVIASRTIFDVIPARDQLLADLQIWLQMERDVCIEPIWWGQIDGIRIDVHGNIPLAG